MEVMSASKSFAICLFSFENKKVNCGRQWEIASLICVCVGLPVQMRAEQIEVGAHFFSLSANLPPFDARIWPHFHVKTCGLSN